MKTKLLILIAVLALFTVPATAQFSTINLTTLTTNTVTENGTLTIPAAGVTNDSATFNRTNVVKGDQTAVAFAKVNANFEFVRTNGIKIYAPTNLPVGSRWVTNGQYVFYPTNTGGLGTTYTFAPTNLPVGTPWVTNGSIIFYPTNTSGLGGSSDTNKVPVYNGGATNLTVTNAFTLTSTTPYYTVASVTFTNGTWGDTNQDGTYYASDGSYGPGSLTNSNGDVIFVSDITSNIQSRVYSVWVTNGVGSGYYYPVSKTYAVFTNSTLTLTTNGSSTNYISYGNGTPGQTIYNVIAVVSGAGNSVYNQTYLSLYTSYPDVYVCTTNNGLTGFDLYGQTSSSKTVMNENNTFPAFKGAIGTYYSGACEYYIPTNLTVGKTLSNGVPYQMVLNTGGTAPAPTVTFYYSFASGSPTYTTTTNYSTNAVYNWTYFATNAWQFFSSTNSFAIDTSGSGTVTAVGVTNLFYLTNAPFIPLTNFVYYGNHTNPVIFTLTNDYALDYYDPPHFFMNFIPGAGQVAFTQAGTNATTIGSLANGGFYGAVKNMDCSSAYNYNLRLILLGLPGTFNYTCGGLGGVVYLQPNVTTSYH